MQRSIDFSRPDIVYFIVWTVTLLVAWVNPIEMYRVPMDSIVSFYIVLSILSFYLVYWLLRLLALDSKLVATVDFRRHRMLNDFSSLYYEKRAFKILFYAWVVLYAVQVFVSGGVPLAWVLMSDSRTYSSFGVPTLGGLLNIFRSFMLTYVVYVIFADHFRLWKRTTLYGYMFLFLFVAYFVELSRGNGIVLMLHGVMMFLSVTKFNIKKIFSYLIMFCFFVMAFGFFEVMRYGFDVSHAVGKASLFSGSDSDFKIWHLAMSLFMYVSAPLANLNLQMDSADLFDFGGVISLLSFLPTIIRSYFEAQGGYGLLVSEAYNTATFISPLLRDFGIFGSFAIVIVVQSVVSYVHIRSYTNRLYLFAYAPLFMSVLLSPFAMFFFFLMTVVFPFVVILFFGFARDYKSFFDVRKI